MATIDELISQQKDWVPGSLRVQEKAWKKNYFIPYFKIDRTWHGIYNGDEYEKWHEGIGDWQIYQEPKKKVVKWLWADRNGCVSNFHTEEINNGSIFTTKLEWSKTEFEE